MFKLFRVLPFLLITAVCAQDSNEALLNYELEQIELLLTQDLEVGYTELNSFISQFDPKIKSEIYAKALVIKCEAYLVNGDFEKLNELVSKFAGEIEQQGYYQLFARLNYCKVSMQFSRGENLKAMQVSNQLIEKGQALNRDWLIFYGYLGRGNAYYQSAYYELALQDLIRANDFFQFNTVQDKHLENVILTSLGNIQASLQNYQEALGYYTKALSYFIELDDFSNQALIKYNIGSALKNSLQYQQAMDEYRQAIVLAQQSGNSVALAHGHRGIAEIQLLQNDFSLASANLNKALELYRQIKAHSRIASSQVLQGIIYRKQSAFTQSETSIKKALGFYETQSQLDGKMRALKELSLTQSAMGQFEQSLKTYQRYKEVSDEVFDISKQAAKERLRVQFDMRLKERENTILQNENEIALLKLAQQKEQLSWLTIISAVLVSTIIPLFLLNRRKKQLIKQLDLLSRTDDLTGIYNRRYIVREFKQEVMRSRRYAHPFSIMVIDIDHFKNINDTYGHDAGDRALISVSNEINNLLRAQDCLGRMGGEEFLVTLPETSIREAKEIAERLRESVERMVFGDNLSMTISIGCAELSSTQIDEKGLFKDADNALYKAKAQGRNQVVCKL